MAPKKNAVASFEELIQANRKERNAKLAQDMLGTDPKKLAQEMLGKNRRSQTPRATGPPATLAGRMGVTKRSNSVPRPNTAPPRNPRQMPHTNLRQPAQDARPKPVSTASASQVVRSNGHGQQRAAPEINIRGAANAAYIVEASNFAPGTTAADIESVMASVADGLNYCKIVATSPSVVAEMEFVDKAGADAVIETFHNKKADGRILYVYYAKDGAPSATNQRSAAVVEPEVIPTEDTMEVDANAIEREEQDRLRAERRGRDERPQRDDRPTAHRYDDRNYAGNYNQDNRGQYSESRSSGYGGGGYGGGRGGRGGRGEFRGGFPGRGGGNRAFGGYGMGQPDGGNRREGGQSYRP